MVNRKHNELVGSPNGELLSNLVTECFGSPDRYTISGNRTKPALSAREYRPKMPTLWRLDGCDDIIWFRPELVSTEHSSSYTGSARVSTDDESRQ